MRSAVRLVAAAALAFQLTACAGPVERWIVQTRVHQGDTALERGSLREAQTAYRLALRVAPNDSRARAGFAAVAARIAEVEYAHGDFDDAIATLNEAARYTPSDLRLAALRSEIESARLKREIVLSNYPTFEGSGLRLQSAYVALDEQNKLILHSLRRFTYTFDTQDLTKAIQDSYEMQLDLVRNLNRLIAYRQVVESGVPASQRGEQSVTPSGSLLPLP